MDLIFAQVLAGQNERKPVAKIVVIFLGDGDALQRIRRSIRHFFDALPAVVIKNVSGLTEFAIHGAAIKRLHNHILRVRVVVARVLKDAFLAGKLLEISCALML